MESSSSKFGIKSLSNKSSLLDQTVTKIQNDLVVTNQRITDEGVRIDALIVALTNRITSIEQRLEIIES
jgi:hypothetical protein